MADDTSGRQDAQRARETTGGATSAATTAADLNKQIVAALGTIFVPSKEDDPGYKELEAYGISEYVTKKLENSETIEEFNTAAEQFFEGKTFLKLDEKQREEYLALLIEGTKITQEGQRRNLQTFYRTVRSRILTVYYKNYPLHEVKRNSKGEPILQPSDTHQITNPNLFKSKKLVTGWDIAGFKGPLSWEEEEQLRKKAKARLNYWYEGDLVKLNADRPPAAVPSKSSDGHDYYDVVVVGGGTAGCIIAGRLSERGINPKTGDRLKVAMIEGGDDWTIRDPGIKPGYGSAIRRRMCTNIPDDVGPEGTLPGPDYRWPGDVGGPGAENFRLVGGCSLHYGGQCWMPGEEDFNFYREASGVDWDLAKFGDAIQEVRDLFHVTSPPDTWWTKGDQIWADAGRALGFEMRATSIAFRNSLGTFYDGDFLSRYDSKGTSLPWAYIGLNNGLKVIPNAEVQRIVIEKVPGGRPLATGVVYTDKAGGSHQVRAARVIVACATNWTPLLLYKSGYGPREFLGDKLLVENKNVGHHLSGDCDLHSSVFLEEPVTPEGRQGETYDEHGAWTSTTPRPWGELAVQIRSSAAGRAPETVALGAFAPEFGWGHKEYMRNGAGVRCILGWNTHLGAIPWSWRVRPDGKLERVEIDLPRVDATVREAGEIVRAWSEKLSIKPIKPDFHIFSRPSTAIQPQHRVGTARAGSSPETSVCTSDFDCHDIDHLLFTSSATIPRTFFWSCGPTAVNAAYGWRRMIANHFSTGCSTKGFA